MLGNRSRLRLVVVQVMVVSLFVTLFARLWYLQVASGDTYAAAAHQNTVRDVEISAPRGLIVDDVGRPLVANRTSWVVTVDRDVLARLGGSTRAAIMHRLAGTLGLSDAELERRVKLCGEPGAAPAPVCWNGSPYEPVPVAEDVPEDVAATILEQSEDYPGVTAEARKVRAYPSPYGMNAAQLLGYISPVTAGELEQARRSGDDTITPLSLVGRSGLEREYDRYLRGVPGDHQVIVDSMGRVIGSGREREPVAGDTLVTSIDAKVQAVVEHQLRQTIITARHTYDPVTHRNYVADSGAALVLDPKTGQVIAMASYPTYDPDVWVGGISQGDLRRLYSKQSGTPLLERATQAQMAPGSTFKPFIAAGAMTYGDYGPRTRLDCSSYVQVGDRAFKNYESASYGMISFADALRLSCDTFFYRVGYGMWVAQGANEDDPHTPDALVKMAKQFGFGSPTGIDLPGETPGRIADRRWKLAYWKANKDYYCRLGKQNGEDFIHVFAREFCTEGYLYRAGDAVNYSIGQGDTIVTPLQLATAYAAFANGGILWKPRVGAAIVSPEGRLVRRIEPQRASRVPVPKKVLRYIDQALLGTAQSGTTAWRFIGFPLDKVKIRSKTGSAEVYGKQSTSWLASYNKQYVVVMMISQAGTGSGTSGPAVRKIWEALYGIHGSKVVRADAAQPGAHPPSRLPTFEPNGSIQPPPVMRAPARDYLPDVAPAYQRRDRSERRRRPGW